MATTLIIWTTIVVTGLQTWWDRQSAEDAAYDHVVDTAHQLEKAVQAFLAQNRALARGILYEMSPERRAVSTTPCPLVCSAVLVELQRRWFELFPGIELLMLDPEGRVAAATETDMHNRLSGLAEVASNFHDHPDLMAVVRYARNSRNEHALLVSRALRDAQGKMEAVFVVLQPVAVLNELLKVPQLGPGRAVTLVDGDGSLLARDPPSILVHFGQKRKQLVEEHRPARGLGSYYAVSKIDRVDRLWVQREIPFSWASGSLLLYVGKSTDDFLGDWRRSTVLNGIAIVTLLIGWTWGLHVFRHHAKSRAQLLATVDLLHKVMESTPVPVVVVSQAGGSVVMSNGAMLSLFGALATVGQPMRMIFGDDKVLERMHESQMGRTEVDLVSRNGPIHAELHGTDLGDLGKPHGHCWLMLMVDVSDRFKREQHLQLEATTDALTGLTNRRQYMLLAEAAIVRAREKGMTLSVLVLDLDHFKRVNDEHGHDIGDLVLTTVAQIFKGVLRDSDVAARLGGEEFAALLPRSDQVQAAMVGERIRRAIASTPILLRNSEVLTMTVSIGVSAWHPDDADIQVALKRADLALYAAKKNGRNRVESGEENVSAA